MATATTIDESTFHHVYLARDKVVRQKSNAVSIGTLDDIAVKALSTLAREELVHIELTANPASGQSLKIKNKKVVAFASAIIYGPEDLADNVGNFLDKCKYSLQYPYGCKHNVPYINPHCVSGLFDSTVMTFDLHQLQGIRAEFSLSASLKALETGDDLPEYHQPAALKTELHRYVNCGLLVI